MATAISTIKALQEGGLDPIDIWAATGYDPVEQDHLINPCYLPLVQEYRLSKDTTAFINGGGDEQWTSEEDKAKLAEIPLEFCNTTKCPTTIDGVLKMKPMTHGSLTLPEHKEGVLPANIRMLWGIYLGQVHPNPKQLAHSESRLVECMASGKILCESPLVVMKRLNVMMTEAFSHLKMSGADVKAYVDLQIELDALDMRRVQIALDTITLALAHELLSVKDGLLKALWELRRIVGTSTKQGRSTIPCIDELWIDRMMLTITQVAADVVPLTFDSFRRWKSNRYAGFLFALFGLDCTRDEASPPDLTCMLTHVKDCIPITDLQKTVANGFVWRDLVYPMLCLARIDVERTVVVEDMPEPCQIGLKHRRVSSKRPATTGDAESSKSHRVS